MWCARLRKNVEKCVFALCCHPATTPPDLRQSCFADVNVVTLLPMMRNVAAGEKTSDAFTSYSTNLHLVVRFFPLKTGSVFISHVDSSGASDRQ